MPDDGYNCDNSCFGLAAIDFQKTMEGGTPWRLALMPKRSARSIADAGGNSIVHEASVPVPLGDLQTRFIAGQIPDWSGHGDVQPTLTPLATRSPLPDFTEPTAYTGAGAGMKMVRDPRNINWLRANFRAAGRNPVTAPG